jgi:regulator of sigma E protease
VNQVLAIAAAVVAFSLLIVVHEAGHMAVARLLGMRVERFSIGFGKVLASFRRGDTEYAISALPLGGYVRIRGMAPGEEVPPDDRTAYCNQAAWRRLLAIAAGPGMNYLGAVLLAAVLVSTSGLHAADPAPRVGVLMPGMPAEEAGLRTGDRIVAVAGRTVGSFEDLVDEIQRHPGQTVPFEIVRGEGAEAEHMVLQVTPRDQGGEGRAGFQSHLRLERRPPGPGALVAGWRLTNLHARRQLGGLGRIFSRHPAVSGPLDIAATMVQSARAGVTALLEIAWEVSIALALLNLLPIPALDGGRLVFLGYEIITRRRVNERVESIVHLAGFLALIALMLAVTFLGDVPKLAHRIFHH